jgi:2-polyprenyl-3-methyl-5-hydroxy-6-metoxy-1,4-benzoquinol methylase
MQLAASMEALAALAAHLRVEREGLAVPDEIRTLLASIAHEVAGPTAHTPQSVVDAVVGMARSLLRLSSDVAEHPDRIGQWTHTDDVILQGMGRMSMAIVDAVSTAAGVLPALGERLTTPGSEVLDVGTGAGWLSIALARTFPAVSVTGIDIFEPALELARANVAGAALTDRVSLVHRDASTLASQATYDVIWLPLPFLPAPALPSIIESAVGALRPGGWLLPGTFAGPPGALSEMLVDLRIVRSGGTAWSVAEMVGMLRAGGLSGAHEVERTWTAPVRLFAAHRG